VPSQTDMASKSKVRQTEIFFSIVASAVPGSELKGRSDRLYCY
jgi:hypothetical protein